MIKRLLSFLLPIKIHQKKSIYSKNLEVTWNNGYLVLDSENTNYSFGSLQRVLKKGLKYIGYERIQNFQSILVLGVAGGSVIETLKKEVKFDGKTYYGCCEMCKERIPKDATVRMAIDPYSHKQVDKANAVIAVTGNNGEVSYFENKENYAKYVKKQ